MTVFDQSAKLKTKKPYFDHMAVELSFPKRPRSRCSASWIKSSGRLKLALHLGFGSKLAPHPKTKRGPRATSRRLHASLVLSRRHQGCAAEATHGPQGCATEAKCTPSAKAACFMPNAWIWWQTTLSERLCQSRTYVRTSEHAPCQSACVKTASRLKHELLAHASPRARVKHKQARARSPRLKLRGMHLACTKCLRPVP